MSCAEYIQQHFYQKGTKEELVQTIEDEDFFHSSAKGHHTTELQSVQTKMK